MKKILFGLLILTLTFCVSCRKNDDTLKENGEDIVDDYKLSIIAPSGAPAMSMANLAYNYKDDYSIELDKTAQSLGASFVSKDADVILAPINMGAKTFHEKKDYVLASVITWGNLYFASQKPGFKLEDLNHQNVILFGEGTINDVIVQYVLKEKGIILGGNTQYLPSTKETSAQLISNPEVIVLVAEPVLSTVQSKKSGITAISVQSLYKEVSEKNSYPQAGCFIKKETINNHPKVIGQFLERYKESCNLCNTDTDRIAEYAEKLEIGTKDIMKTAIINSNIAFIEAKTAKKDIEIMVALAPNLFGGEQPTDDFYYA